MTRTAGIGPPGPAAAAAAVEAASSMGASPAVVVIDRDAAARAGTSESPPGVSNIHKAALQCRSALSCAR